MLGIRFLRKITGIFLGRFLASECMRDTAFGVRSYTSWSWSDHVRHRYSGKKESLMLRVAPACVL